MVRTALRVSYDVSEVNCGEIESFCAEAKYSWNRSLCIDLSLLSVREVEG